MKDRLKKALFDILIEYIKFTEKEYRTNPAYNNSYLSYQAEENMVDYLIEENLFQEFVKYKESLCLAQKRKI